MCKYDDIQNSNELRFRHSRLYILNFTNYIPKH